MKVSNLTKALKKAKYEELYGDELAALSISMFWIFDLEQKLKDTRKPPVEQPKKKKRNVRSKSKSR